MGTILTHFNCVLWSQRYRIHTKDQAVFKNEFKHNTMFFIRLIDLDAFKKHLK